MEVEPTLVPTSLLAGLMDMAEVGEVGGCGELRPSHSGELPRSAEELRRSFGSGEEDLQEPGEPDELSEAPSSKSRRGGRVLLPAKGGVGAWSRSSSSTGKDCWIHVRYWIVAASTCTILDRAVPPPVHPLLLRTDRVSCPYCNSFRSAFVPSA